MRKDVLIARITFIILCLAIVGIIVSVASRISGSRKEKNPDAGKDKQQEENLDTEYMDPSTETSEIVEPVEPAEPVVVYVKTTKSVNLRSAADTESDVLKVLEADEKLELISEADGWAEVVAGEQTGFVNMDFLEYVQEEETGADPITGSSTVLKVTTSAVRMRKGPGTDQDILMTIDSGITLEILEEADGWAKVTYQGQTGYVSGDYLQ